MDSERRSAQVEPTMTARGIRRHRPDSCGWRNGSQPPSPHRVEPMATHAMAEGAANVAPDDTLVMAEKKKQGVGLIARPLQEFLN